MAGLANGCAIVTTEPVGAAPQLVDGHNVLLTAPGEPQQMAAAVAKLYSDQALAKHIGENARTLSAEFRWEQIARSHLDAYTKARP